MLPDKNPLVFRKVKLADLERIADAVLKAAGKLRVFAVSGELGAGKTTFIKAAGRVAGVTDSMSSPTFSIINEYKRKNGERLLHFDFYRIASEAEAADIGVEEYFDSGDYCFVEWPERIPSLLPEDCVNVRLTIESDTLRQIEISIHGREKKERI
jgi:tRNA threonylcarbamoyladenosine biosynthesis protein TsaE